MIDFRQDIVAMIIFIISAVISAFASREVTRIVASFFGR